MKKSTIVIIVVIIIVIVGGIYWIMQSSSTSSVPPEQTSDVSQTPVAPPTLSTGSSATLGSYLTAQNGMALYTYSKDTSGAASTCTDTCATTWPPYVVSSASDIVPDTTMAGAVGTYPRDDGTLQVTYNGMPLYFYAQDAAAGDTSGDGVGGVWAVAKP